MCFSFFLSFSLPLLFFPGPITCRLMAKNDAVCGLCAAVFASFSLVGGRTGIIELFFCFVLFSLSCCAVRFAFVMLNPSLPILDSYASSLFPIPA
jgi:hypothetical protein